MKNLLFALTLLAAAIPSQEQQRPIHREGPAPAELRERMQQLQQRLDELREQLQELREQPRGRQQGQADARREGGAQQPRQDQQRKQERNQQERMPRQQEPGRQQAQRGRHRPTPSGQRGRGPDTRGQRGLDRQQLRPGQLERFRHLQQLLRLRLHLHRQHGFGMRGAGMRGAGPRAGQPRMLREQTGQQGPLPQRSGQPGRGARGDAARRGPGRASTDA